MGLGRLRPGRDLNLPLVVVIVQVVVVVVVFVAVVHGSRNCTRATQGSSRRSCMEGEVRPHDVATQISKWPSGTHGAFYIPAHASGYWSRGQSPEQRMRLQCPDCWPSMLEHTGAARPPTGSLPNAPSSPLHRTSSCCSISLRETPSSRRQFPGTSCRPCSSAF